MNNKIKKKIKIDKEKNREAMQLNTDNNHISTLSDSVI